MFLKNLDFRGFIKQNSIANNTVNMLTDDLI